MGTRRWAFSHFYDDNLYGSARLLPWQNMGDKMNIPKGWPTEEMLTVGVKALNRATGISSTMDDEGIVRFVFRNMLAAAPTLPDRHRADCSVVCLASQDDGIICPYDSCDIEDGTRATPTPPAQSGPDFEDGCDHEGFTGGCERMGHSKETCPHKPAQENEPVKRDMRMNAYHYSFDTTGILEIDKILSAVACAGKAYHSTSEWHEDTDPYRPHTGQSPV